MQLLAPVTVCCRDSLRRGLGLLTLLVAACAGPSEPVADESGLARFAPACRFVPAGMESHWFIDNRLQEVGASLHGGVVAVRAARSFEPPSRPGWGRHEYVIVEDHGAVAPSPADWRAVAQGAYDGVPVWRFEESAEPGDWAAIAAERFVVLASSRALLEAALARRGDLEVILSSLPDLTPIATDAADLIVCRPRSPGVEGVSFPSPSSPTFYQVRRGSMSFEMFSVDRAPAAYFERYRFVEAADAGVYRRAVWPIDNATGRMVFLCLAFGLQVFI